MGRLPGHLHVTLEHEVIKGEISLVKFNPRTGHICSLRDVQNGTYHLSVSVDSGKLPQGHLDSFPFILGYGSEGIKMKEISENFSKGKRVLENNDNLKSFLGSKTSTMNYMSKLFAESSSYSMTIESKNGKITRYPNNGMRFLVATQENNRIRIRIYAVALVVFRGNLFFVQQKGYDLKLTRDVDGGKDCSYIINNPEFAGNGKDQWKDLREWFKDLVCEEKLGKYVPVVGEKPKHSDKFLAPPPYHIGRGIAQVAWVAYAIPLVGIWLQIDGKKSNKKMFLLDVGCCYHNGKGLPKLLPGTKLVIHNDDLEKFILKNSRQTRYRIK